MAPTGVIQQIQGYQAWDGSVCGWGLSAWNYPLILVVHAFVFPTSQVTDVVSSQDAPSCRAESSWGW